MKNKDKYDLNKLRISVTYIITGIADIKIHCGIKCIYYKSYDVEDFASRWITDFIKWLEEDDGKECKPKILTDEEKAYLSAIIKPFRKDVAYIEKCIFSMETDYVLISMKTSKTVNLPNFRRKSMYTGMKENRRYTLEDLGL